MKRHIVYTYRLRKNQYLMRLINFLLLIQSILREVLWGFTQRKRIKVGVLFSNVKTNYGLHGIGHNLDTPALKPYKQALKEKPI